MNATTILPTLLPVIPTIVGIAIVLLLLMKCIKVVSGNEVLVVTGVGATKKKPITVKTKDGQEEIQMAFQPKIRIAGAAFVWPFIQRARKFDVCMEKVEKNDDTMKTTTGVEIVIDWGISYAPNADTVETLQPAIRQFLDKDKEEIRDIIQSVVAGGLRAVISTMTPKEVMVGKESLDESVQKNIAEQMIELGYKVQIYIQEVRDAKNSTYYHDLAAEDREGTRRKAAETEAAAQQAIREKKAETERVAKQAEVESEVEIAEKERDAALRKATFKGETDIAEADANIAGSLRKTEREKELAEMEGQVEVMRQNQANAAAKAEQELKVTQAETAKKEVLVNAEAEADRKKIEASAEAEVRKTEAEGEAKAALARAAGESDAAKKRAEGEAEKIRVTGQAEADATKAKGEAEAAAIRAKGEAEAAAARALSDAQAANDRVNYELELRKVEWNAKVEIATNVATVMAKVGENATFYDFGGHDQKTDGQDLLTRVMSNIPAVFAQANLQNQALNGKSLPDTVEQLVDAFAAPFKKTATADTEQSKAAEDSVTVEDDSPVGDNPEGEDTVSSPVAEGVAEEAKDSFF